NSYMIIKNDGSDSITGTFNGLPEGATITAPNGRTFKITYQGGDGNDVVLFNNTAPVANNDSVTTAEDTSVSGNVLANDSDVENDSLTAVLNTAPAHGTVALAADGSFTYTPAANYNGADSFTYRASDGQANSNVATVSIAVTPVNDAPVANNDTAAT